MVSHINTGTVPWPQDVAASYVVAGYWEGRALGDHLWKQADRTPAHLAVVDADTRLTYADLVDRADAAATRLSRLGIRAGDRMEGPAPVGVRLAASPRDGR